MTFTVDQLMKIRVEAKRKAVYDATGRYEPFTKEWHNACDSIFAKEYMAMTTPPNPRCDCCGRCK